MDIKLILKLAKVSEATYDNPDKAKIKFKALGYDIVKYFENDGAEAYIIKNSEEFVLSFRGTQVTQMSDIVADLKAGKTISDSGGKVHIGFNDEVNKLWSDIMSNIFEHIPVDKNFHITGHSLGAAMATIAASRLQEKITTLVTFGSPRVGTKEFVESIQVDHYRVQNNNDDVVKVPPYLLGYRHHGENVYLNYQGEIRKKGIWGRVQDMILSRLLGWKFKKHFKGITDHLMDNYISKLEKNV